MESKKINQLATSVSPQTSDLTIIGDPTTGVSKKITLLQIANLFATTGTVSSVAVTETGDALTITGSPITSAGTINIGFAGDATQYIRGDGALADFPTSTGGGSSVSYYLNSSVSQGTIGGVAYRQLSKTPIAGAGTDITISANGYIASYLTDANDPALLEVPGGNFNCEFYFSVNSNAHNPYVYAELYKYDGTTFTLIGSSQSVPEYLTNGTTLSPYYFAIPVAQTVLTITDRIAIRIFVNVDGRTVTLHTENNHLCQVVTTFSKGLTTLNNLTRQVQFFGTGTSGTDFNISSSTATHTFNLPIASATNTGKLSSTDWSTFNGKQPAGNYVTLDTTQTITAAKTFSLDILVNGLTIGEGAGSISTNTAIGSSALPVNTTGSLNTAIGNSALLTNTTGYGNTSVGHSALAYNTTGFFNAAIGVNALLSNTTGTYNNALGTASLYNNTTGSNNTAVGQVAGTNNTTGSNNTYIGFGSGGGITTGSNNTIIGQFTGTAAMANNIVLADGAGNVRYQWNGTNNVFGNPISGTSSTFSSSVTALSIIKSGGTSSQFLMADGSVNTSVLPSGAYLPLTGGTLTGALSGTSATFTSSSFPLDIYGTTNNYGLRINNVQAATLFLYSSNANAASRNWGLFTNSEVYGDFDIRQSNAINGDLTNGANSTSRLYIKNDGNVGIGTSSPSEKLDVIGGGLAAGNGTIRTGITFSSLGLIGTFTNHDLGVITNGAERMRITSGGDLQFGNNNSVKQLINSTSGSFGQLQIGNSGSNSEASMSFISGVTAFGTPTSVNGDNYIFGVGAGIYGIGGDNWGIGNKGFNNYIAKIAYNSTSWTFSSDIRLKNIIGDVDNVLNKVCELKPVYYNWKSDEYKIKKVGLIAQEVYELFPDIVDVPKSELDDNGYQTYWGLNYGDLTPIIIAAIQELKAQIEDLKAKIK